MMSLNSGVKLLSVIGLILLFSACTSINAYFGGKKETLNRENVDFYIPTHTNLEQLKSLLVEQNIIDDLDGFQAVLDYKEFKDERQSEEHTSELQSRPHLVCRLLLEKK